MHINIETTKFAKSHAGVFPNNQHVHVHLPQKRCNKLGKFLSRDNFFIEQHKTAEKVIIHFRIV